MTGTVRILATWLVLGLAFELPSLWLLAPARLTAELWLILLTWLTSLPLRRRFGVPLRAALVGALGVVAIVQIDRVVFVRFMGEEPLLYDQLFMLRHAAVLLSDLWSPRSVALVAAALLTLMAAGWGVRKLLQHVVADRAAARTSCVVLAASIAVLSLSGLMRFMTPALLDNLHRSRELYSSVQHEVVVSSHSDLQSLQLTRKPNVYLIFVESYGRVIAEHPAMRQLYGERIRAMQQSLSESGWHSASAYSAAPVMGGRSWLAEGSVLMGIRVRYETMFRQLIEQIDKVPNLVSFLGAQGYRTVLLAPADRPRPGVEEVNYYGYETSLGFNSLAYHGPRYGWGIIPDQYSLGYASEHALADSPQPLFLNIHLVTSHAPWGPLPELVDDWRALDVDVAALADEVDDSIGSRLQRYLQKSTRFADEGELDDALVERYRAAIDYELAVLTRYLRTRSDDALVVMLGDHQPPFLAAETRNFDTPVHVLARDPQLLAAYTAAGFRSGMSLPIGEPACVRHEQLFPLIAHSLAECCVRAQATPR
jgi:hypothetical protein